VIAPVCAMAIVMGIVPGMFLKPMEPAVRKTIEEVRPAGGRPVNTERLLDPGPGPGAHGAGEPTGMRVSPRALGLGPWAY
jgi:hypothetical protein